MFSPSAVYVNIHAISLSLFAVSFVSWRCGIKDPTLTIPGSFLTDVINDERIKTNLITV